MLMLLIVRFFPEGRLSYTQNINLRKIFHPIKLMAETIMKSWVQRGLIPSNFPKFSG